MIESSRFTVTNLYVYIRDKWQTFSPSVTSLLDDGKKKNPIAVLDGVRAIACLAILSFQLNSMARDANIWHPIHDFGSFIAALAFFGQSGVQLFFVLSGFLLFMPYAKSLLFHTPWPSLRRFYLRRIFRIVPAYYVALALIILLIHPEYVARSHLSDIWLFLTFRMDFPQTFQQVSSPFWTLAVEFQFYLLLPILAWVIGLVVRRGSLRWRLISLTTCLSLVVAWGMFALYWGLKLSKISALNILISPNFVAMIRPYIYGGTGKSLEVFGLGMLLSTAYVYSQNASPESRWTVNMRRISPILFLAGLAFLLLLTLWHFYVEYFNYSMHFFDRYQAILVNSWDQWQGILYAISFTLCIAGLLYGPTLLRRPFEWLPLRWLGLISFSFYLWHGPLLFVFEVNILPILHAAAWHHVPEYIALVLWSVLVIIPFSLCSYLWVELPWIRTGERVLYLLVKQNTKQKLIEVDKSSVSVPAGDALAETVSAHIS